MQEWVNLELSKIEQSYVTKGLNMIGAYRREIERSKEYHGRQLLELLQNADDEAEHTDNPSVLIKLKQDRLIIMNNGTPFSEDGILSLMYSDISPKIRRKGKIGYKGLGFRSILNWSHSIWIKSGQFSIEFSRDNAIGFLKSLLEKHPELKTEIENTSTENEKFPIATLAVPKWKEDGNIDIATYDTYIVINFSSEKVRQDIQKQISELDMEVALFLNNLKIIKLESPERKESIIRISPKDDGLEEIQLQNEDGEIIDSKKWRIFKTEGELPEKLRQNEMTKQFEYDLRIAVSEKLNDNINRLFSFFKTEVRFPFPAIIHGTFDLDGNRNHLNLNDVNGFLLEKLAELMIDTAKKLTQVNDEVNWDAMKLLSKKGDFDDKVVKMNFYEKLLDKMKSHKLIPVVSNKYMSVDEKPAFFRTPYARIIKQFPEVFQDLALYTDDSDVQDLIEELGIEKYEPGLFIGRLNQISNYLKIPDRAELILKIANNYVSDFKPIKERKMPNLFIDADENVIGSKTQALMPPERSCFQLPRNVTITFISNQLFNILKAKAEVKTGRSLVDKIKCFNVQEYRLDSVIRRTVTSTKRFIRKNAAKRVEHIRTMLQTLFSIFKEDNESEKFPNIDVPIISRKGEPRNANELYFGKEYKVGKIMDSLYSNIDDSVFTLNKEELGFRYDDETKVTEFLTWIGVERFPRIRIKQISDSAYEDFILRNVKYPYTTDYSEAYGSYEEFKREKYLHSSKITISQIEKLDVILEKAGFEDIIVWLNTDSRMSEIVRNGYELPGSVYEFRLIGKTVNRTMFGRDIASYIVWKIKNASWIKTESGKKVKPEICCLSKTLIDMSPFIEVPALIVKDKVFKENNISQKDIEYILIKIGVSENFANLPTDTIYTILQRLETVDPEGKHARNIYRQIIESKPREWSRKVVEQEVREKFVENGKVLAKSDIGVGYFPVKSVYYIDNVTFCKEIIKKFPIVAIDRRSGKEQVKDIFGVNPLEDIKFELIGEPKRHHLDPVFSKAFETFKPYILTYRLQKPTVDTELNRLKRLKIILCTKINARYKYNDIEDKLVLNPYEHIQAEGENTAFMLLDPEKRCDSLKDLKNDIRFCESFAEIITGILKVGENRKDFRDLFPKDKAQRDLVIKSDLDDHELEKFKTARERFKNQSNLEKEFWQTILEAKGGEISIIELGQDFDVKKIISNT
ncbi:sacsin N-terminal ATP-binding-like domain-containing protein, partial [bacterium]